jgi:glutamate dehydrogenase (NAD(P)+)
MRPEEMRIVVQGFGNVGSWVARIACELGCQLVGASDVSGAIASQAGIDPGALLAHIGAGGRLSEYPGTGVEAITPDELLALDCEVLIPAALGGTIHAGNADSIRARLIIEGANSPTTPTADEILGEKGIAIVPDVLANAGGVIVSYFEWVQNLQHFSWGEREVNDKLGNIIRRAYRDLSDRSERDQVPMRVAAYQLGIERVLEAARDRGYV